jgi:ATP synthase delta (OSCP) subunit
MRCASAAAAVVVWSAPPPFLCVPTSPLHNLLPHPLAHAAVQPLDKLERVELRKQAAEFVPSGWTLVMQEKVDRKLIGGFILEFEDRLIDKSVAKKLSEFNEFVFKLEGDLRA